MRTKALLLGAMIGAASLVTSMAQVYSVNIVGYVNTTIPHGFSIVCNPLNATGGNTIVNVMPVPPVGVSIYKFRNATGDYSQNDFDTGFGEWGDPTMTVSPGEGLFVFNAGTNFTWTFVGEVPTGTQTITLPQGFNLIASIIPQTGHISSDLGYIPTGDIVYKFRNATSDYETYTYDTGFGEWDVEPEIAVGEGFFLWRGTAGSWTRTFNVGP
jgi:hypothetical protein